MVQAVISVWPSMTLACTKTGLRIPQVFGQHDPLSQPLPPVSRQFHARLALPCRHPGCSGSPRWVPAPVSSLSRTSRESTGPVWKRTRQASGRQNQAAKRKRMKNRTRPTVSPAGGERRRLGRGRKRVETVSSRPETFNSTAHSKLLPFPPDRSRATGIVRRDANLGCRFVLLILRKPRIR
jgi:hypothetical protein